ncbi:succinylglutamate desuccinylase/aspartoacylase domain-containing protein [Halegenticoccus tardaugens]|uniref:succinylglutamate desuccinylase/aspartoacylase domain-containing protein n=1 Tax=Halegenticoccus tardaugens TaxID=2071624 RepID=UPI00100A246A|nr:succinylglutamate desuccinylase/aspartoacylase family protein [Halegenticoccus tardaugens]
MTKQGADEHAAVESTTNSTRRTFLRHSGGVLAASTIGFAGAGTASANSITRDTFTIRDDTAEETEVHVTTYTESGPTALVVGGVHGNEEAGYEAADQITNWHPDCGQLITLPEANAPAVEAETRYGNNGDLNRQFPAGEQPTTALARAIWDVILDYDVDITFDLHSSYGIYEADDAPEASGQAIYPTSANGARANAGRTVDYMNENHDLTERSADHEFVIGNTLTGKRPLLIHKVAADLDRPGYLVEVTQYETGLTARIQWSKKIVKHLLGQHSIGVSTGQ